MSKKVDAKTYLIFKYVVETTRLKTIIPNLYRQTNFFFFEIEPREGTSVWKVNFYRISIYKETFDDDAKQRVMDSTLQYEIYLDFFMIDHG